MSCFQNLNRGDIKTPIRGEVCERRTNKCINMEQETNSNLDICNLLSGGTLGEYRLSYEKVVKLLNETKAVDKKVDSNTYSQYLVETREALKELEIMFEQLTEDDNIAYLTDKCKEKFYELAGQIDAMYASNMEQSKFENKALDYYKKYQTIVQRYKIPDALKERDEIIVYSFRKYSVFTLEDLINETITVVRPSKMNDPFDSIADLWRKTECLKNITGGKGHEDLFNRSMNYFRIRSFQADRKSYSANNDILQSVKMWSHYADNHQGFCIKYRLKKKFFRDINEKDSIVLRIAPVEYEEQSVIDKSMKTLDAFDAYFVKNKEWEEECEVRLLSYNPHTEEDHYAVPMDDDAKIEEVIFGYLCTDDCKKTIYNLLSPKGVGFYIMDTIPETDIFHLIKKEYCP